MIKLENTEVVGWEAAIRGMRNPMNSWEKSDSEFITSDGDYHDICGNSGPCYDPDSWVYMSIGPNDHDLMMRLAKAGTDHRKFMRMIVVYVDITAPLYWWKEADTYQVGVVKNSCSTMNKIHEKEFTLEDFSHEQLTDTAIEDCLKIVISFLNTARKMYISKGGESKAAWWQMIQLLPSSYNQRRTVMLNYEVLVNIYHARKEHKLDEWRDFCKWIEELPYSELITGKENKDE